MAMRKSSKVLVFVFFAVAAGLAFFGTRMDEVEIAAAVEERLKGVVAEREEGLAEQEKAIQQRVAALDSAIARVEEPVLTRVTAAQVETLLKRMGMVYEVGVDEHDDPLITLTLASYETKMYFYGCEEEGCTSIRLWAGFNLNTPPTIETLNEWNRTKRYSTAYLNTNDTACLDTDLIISGGVTLAEVEAFIRNFRDRLGEYTTHIGF